MTAPHRHGQFRLFEHTSDVGLLATGPTFDDALAAAIRGLVSVTFELSRIHPTEERTTSLAGSDLARLVVGLLDEVLFLEDTEGFLPVRAKVTVTGTGLDAHLWGETFDPLRHTRAGPQVKAITYHQLTVDPGPPARIRVILDI